MLFAVIGRCKAGASLRPLRDRGSQGRRAATRLGRKRLATGLEPTGVGRRVMPFLPWYAKSCPCALYVASEAPSDSQSLGMLVVS
jgi:hypothetical protein